MTAIYFTSDISTGDDRLETCHPFYGMKNSDWLFFLLPSLLLISASIFVVHSHLLRTTSIPPLLFSLFLSSFAFVMMVQHSSCCHQKLPYSFSNSSVLLFSLFFKLYRNEHLRNQPRQYFCDVLVNSDVFKPKLDFREPSVKFALQKVEVATAPPAKDITEITKDRASSSKRTLNKSLVAVKREASATRARK